MGVKKIQLELLKFPSLALPGFDAGLPHHVEGLAVLPLPVPRQPDEDDAEAHVPDVGEDVVEVRDGEDGGGA